MKHRINEVAHPGYDRTPPRVAVLLTTGRLKGAAPVDAQAFADRMAARGEARMETWDRETLSGWLIADLNSAILSLAEQTDVQRILADIRSEMLDEPTLEVFTRRWSQLPAGAAAIESAMLVNALRMSCRLDLAAMCALHLFRGMHVHPDAEAARAQASAALRLFESICQLLLQAVTPLLDDPVDLAREVASPTALVTYPAMLMRVTELLALAALRASTAEDSAALAAAVVRLASAHPGTARPVSDQFAVSLIPITLVLARRGWE